MRRVHEDIEYTLTKLSVAPGVLPILFFTDCIAGQCF